MLNINFVILFHVVILFNQSFADDWILPPPWCSNNALESLLKCLSEEKYSNRGWFMKYYQKIKCSEEGNCILKPWQVWKSDVKLARTYGKCMKKVTTFYKSKAPIVFHINDAEQKKLLTMEYRCRKDLADNLPKDIKSYYSIILPELNHE